jgi:hypothetical protein
MMGFFWGRPQLLPIAAAVNRYKSTELASPTRSTLPLLALLKDDEPLFKSMLGSMNMPENANLCLEYTVKPPKGTGKVSCTDLIAISGRSSLAIEAKWTEDRYETVKSWLQKGSGSSNRQTVLDGWLGLLQQRSTLPLNPASFSDAVYQMVHRAASACDAGNDPRMAYLIFSPDPNQQPSNTSQLRKDLGHLWNLLGRPERFPFFLVEVQISSTAAFNAIKSLQKGQASTASQVRNALLGSTPLFHFEKFCVTKVG